MFQSTLFLGIGTTGTKILKYLRRLMFEEFIDHAGLPIFRYVAIETDEGETGTDRELRLSRRAQDYEKIHVIHTTIDETAPIKEKINQKKTHSYKSALADWLDKKLVDQGPRSFKAGAGNVRMAGRLCLWETWESVKTELREEIGKLRSPDNHRKTEDLLDNYFKRKEIKGRSPDLREKSCVYVVGSFCGGTCGGMFIDLGYFLADEVPTAGGADPSVSGYFTIYDNSLSEQESPIRAANCYGALYELNFYSHPDTIYSVSFPDGPDIGPTQDPPYDYTLLISRTGRNPEIQFNKEDGTYDEEGWNQMIAMDLFAEAVGGAGDEKKSIRVDWIGNDDYGNAKEPDNKYVRRMASFGLTAVWYPKYRIATATACLMGKDLCQSWLGDSTNKTKIQRLARKAWNQMVESRFQDLTSDGQKSVPQEIYQLLRRAEDQLLKCGNSQILGRKMEAYPTNGESFAKRFSSSGEYYILMKQEKPNFESALKEDLWKVFRTLINKLVQDSEEQDDIKRVDDILEYFKAIDKQMKDQISKLPTEPPHFKLKLDFTHMDRVFKDTSMKLVGTQKASLMKHKKYLIEEYKKQVNSTFSSLRNYFAREALTHLRKEIGIGSIPEDDDIKQPKTIAGEIATIKAKLEGAVTKFDDEYSQAINPEKPINVEIVADNDENSLDIDAKKHQSRVNTSTGLTKLLDETTLHSLLTTLEIEDYVVSMRETFRQEALGKIGKFNAVTKATQLLLSGSSIQTLANRSNPYQAFNAYYESLDFGDVPKLIIGPSAIQGDLGKFRNNLANQDISFPDVQVSDVDHLLFFYEEEAGFALDDLEAFNTLKRRFDERPCQYGHLTHKDAETYDIEYTRRVRLLKEWLSVLEEVLPAIQETYPNSFANSFQPDPKDSQKMYYFAQHNGNVARLYMDGKGVENFSLSENRPFFNMFKNMIRYEFHKIGESQTKQVVNEILSSLGGDEFQEKNEEYNKFIGEIFDPNLSQPTPPPQQQNNVPQAPMKLAQANQTQTGLGQSKSGEETDNSSYANGGAGRVTISEDVEPKHQKTERKPHPQPEEKHRDLPPSGINQATNHEEDTADSSQVETQASSEQTARSDSTLKSQLPSSEKSQTDPDTAQEAPSWGFEEITPQAEAPPQKKAVQESTEETQPAESIDESKQVEEEGTTPSDVQPSSDSVSEQDDESPKKTVDELFSLEEE